MGYALRTDRYRFVAWRANNSGLIVERELYDHQTDPGETRNLASEKEHHNRVTELEKQLSELRKKSPSSTN